MVVKSARVGKKKMKQFKPKQKQPKPRKGAHKSDLNLDRKTGLDAKIHLVTQDLKLAQALACNDKKIRDRFLKNLRKWLNTRANSSFPFTDQDFLRLWKGLFYCMWMSDKPLIQEQLCEDMGSLLYCFDDPKIATQFYGRFLDTMAQEWIGIDQWRVDKFMMLIRRITRHMLFVMHKNEWEVDLLKALRRQISETVLNENKLSFGCTIHFIGLFLEETAKVSEGKFRKSVTGQLLKPFLSFLATTTDSRLIKRVVVDIFYGLLKQSDLGRQHEEKYEAWKEFGFPSENMDEMELVEEEEDEELQTEEDSVSEKVALDPRAGNVNVVLHEIPFSPNKLIAIMEKTLYDAKTRSKNRKTIKKIVLNYQKFANGEYPLGVQKMILPKTENAKMPDVLEKIQELEILENDLLYESRLFKSLSKSQKKNYYKIGGSVKDFVESIKKISKSEAMDVETIKLKKSKRNSSVSQSKGNTSPKKKRCIEEPLNLGNGMHVVDDQEQLPKTNCNSNGVFSVEKDNEWEKPLEEGEVEYFITPTKQRLKHLNAILEKDMCPVLLKNPFASFETPSPKSQKKLLKLQKSELKTPKNKILPGTPKSATEKRVRIVLSQNMAQDTYEYLRQIRNSPQIPFDSEKKPTKSLLKPNLMPSPINPYYKKKIGLKFDN